ncbi:hypothetical protein GGR53DRAFT_524265 [Hypoxylon sp. FL1150]|nr:hypothetical protein GGR53DRAFT_524265 [Hypoxylon sp. FL1150]
MVREMLMANWNLSISSFRGPQFISRFAKMLYCINLLLNCLPTAIFTFLQWSLPGALGTYGLSIPFVSSVQGALPRVVYVFLSGLNATIVGVIALAAVEHSTKAVTDEFSRVVLFLNVSAAWLYSTPWYLPVLILVSGRAIALYNFRWLRGHAKAVSLLIEAYETTDRPIELADNIGSPVQGMIVTFVETAVRMHDLPDRGPREQLSNIKHEARTVPPDYPLKLHCEPDTTIIVAFVVMFSTVIALKALPTDYSVLYNLFANLYLAGTIIVGGGPVVSPRDFLIGLAIAQSFPGPNSNIAVSLGSLTAGTMGIWASVVRGVSAGAIESIYTTVYMIWQIGYIDEGFEAGRSLRDDPWWLLVAATAFVGCRYFKFPPARDYWNWFRGLRVWTRN